MSHHLTQPEEIDMILKYMKDVGDIDAGMEFTDKPVNRIALHSWGIDIGHTSAYRAAYMKTHQFF